ncbi:MAG: hypothetical protein AAB316_14835, partial [Bacteroidota bacterium]
SKYSCRLFFRRRRRMLDFSTFLMAIHLSARLAKPFLVAAGGRYVFSFSEHEYACYMLAFVLTINHASWIFSEIYFPSWQSV